MKDVPAAAVAIAIVIAGVAVVDAVRAAVLEEVMVAIPAVVAADGEEGKIEQRVDSSDGPQRWGPFSMSVAPCGNSRVARPRLYARLRRIGV